jgi:hypothetical protein
MGLIAEVLFLTINSLPSTNNWQAVDQQYPGEI